jgi:hypothetical protein
VSILLKLARFPAEVNKIDVDPNRRSGDSPGHAVCYAWPPVHEDKSTRAINQPIGYKPFAGLFRTVRPCRRDLNRTV